MRLLTMPKVIFCCLLAILAGLAAGAAAQEDKQTWKVGTLTPKGVGWAKQFEQIMLPAIHEATDDTLDVRVYWGGIMGDDGDIISKMRAGQLQAAGITGQGAVIACPEFAVVELPFLFDSYAEVDYIREKMWPTFDRLMRKRGFKLLLWLDQDFDQIYSRKYSFREMEHFEKARFMSWYGVMEEDLLKSLGSSPIPVDIPELVPSLRQGVADSLIAPALWMIATQLYPSVEYMVPLRIRYSPAVVICTLEAWNALSEESRRGMTEVVPDVTRRFTAATRRDNKKAINALVDYGIEKVELPPENVARMKKKAKVVWDDQTGQLYPDSLLEEVLDHLAEFREKKQ
ncbi:MAG: TRAP transporter substrate-binding protein DctP [Desulfosudaceae bacterium]